MSKPSCRRLSVAPLTGVERQGRGSLCSGSLAVGISHSLPSDFHLIQGTHPFSSLLPQLHQGQGFGGRSQLSSGERGCRASSPSLSRLLQPSFCGDEGLRVMEAGDRPFVTEPEGVEDVLQDGDSPVGPVVGPSWRLDGVSGLEGRLSPICRFRCIRNLANSSGSWRLGRFTSSRFFALDSPQVFTRVMAPVSAFLHQAGIRLRRYLDDWLIQASSREQVLLALESVLQLCQELGIVVNWEKSHLIPSQRVEYLGVLLDSVTFRASPSQKRVLKLLSIGEELLSCVRQPASAWLELLGGAGFIDPAHSWGEASDAVSPVLPQSVLGLFRSVFTDSLEHGCPGRSGVVAGPVSSGSRDFSASDLPRARVVVRRLGRRLGRTSRRRVNIRPLISKRAGIVDQCQRASGGGEGFVIFRTSGAGLRNLPVRRQFHSDCLPSQSGRNSVSDSEFHCPKDSAFCGVSEGHTGSSVHHGPTQCDGRCPFSAQSDLGLRMVSKDRSFSGSQEKVACFNRPLCHLTKSLLYTIFLSFPRSERGSHGCFAPELEWVAGVCFSSLVTHSCGSQEAPVIVWSPPDVGWSPPDVDRSLLASASVVPGASGSGCGRSSDTSSLQRSSQTTPLPSIPSGGVKAVASCLETIQRFAQSQGFSKHVAQQSALSRRPSSRAGYQARWAVFRKWCHDKGHSVSRPSLQKIADFLFGLRRTKKLSVFAVMGYRSMLSAVFRSVLPEISSSSVL